MPWILRMILITFAIILIPYGYTAWRLIKALTFICPQHIRLIKYGISFIFIFISLLPVILGISYLVGEYRNLFFDQISILDILFLYPFWIGLIIILETLPYFLASDLFLLIAQWFSGTVKIDWTKWIAVLKISVISFFIFFVSIRIYLDTTKIKISSFEIPIKDLPPVLGELNWVLTADVQVDPYTPMNKMAHFIQQVKSLSPDILFFAGDLVTRGTSFIDQGVNVLCATKARLARIACVGDHDIWSNAGKIADGLQKCGWGFLDNGHQVVSYKGARILVTGVSYVYSKRISPPELQNLLEIAPEADVKIILVHQPSKLVIKTAAKYGYHLLLAGHTHGGQIVLKPFGFTITPTQFENDLYSGIAEEDQMKIIITEGIGVSIIPLRYRAQGEIVEFKFIKK